MRYLLYISLLISSIISSHSDSVFYYNLLPKQQKAILVYPSFSVYSEYTNELNKYLDNGWIVIHTERMGDKVLVIVQKL